MPLLKIRKTSWIPFCECDDTKEVQSRWIIGSWLEVGGNVSSLFATDAAGDEIGDCAVSGVRHCGDRRGRLEVDDGGLPAGEVFKRIREVLENIRIVPREPCD